MKKKAYFQSMNKRLLSIITKYCPIVFCFFLLACQGAPSPRVSDTNLPRADSRYIGWLEKEAIFNNVAEKIKIVSGTSFAWNFSSAPHPKENLAQISPIWLHINPYSLHTQNQQALAMLQNHGHIFKKLQIRGLYPYPTKSSSFESLYAFSSPKKQSFGPISLSLSKELGEAGSLFGLNKQEIQLVGNVLPSSLGIGSDFLLALHGVREYPGLFMMTEIPKELWDILPDSDGGNSFSPQKLDAETVKRLAEYRLVPEHFRRDFYRNFPESGFAASNEILGYDGRTRRWVYRYVYNPYTAVLNFYDPSLQAHRLLTASVIEEIGILRQALVSVSVKDGWGQEAALQTKNAETDALTNGQPALSVLENLNRSVHGYGAWTFLRDSFPPEFLKTLQSAQTDFVCDSLFMPALEQALAEENSEALTKAFLFLQKNRIDETGLWHASPSFFPADSPFGGNSLFAFIRKLSEIEDKEIAMLGKMQESAVFTGTDRQLDKKLQKAQQIQYAFLGFQSLLPGLTVISLDDILGTVSPERQISPFEKNPQTSPLFFGTISEQMSRRNSCLSKLQDIWKIRQKYGLSLGRILGTVSTGNTKTFAFVIKTPQNKKLFAAVNLSPQKQRISCSSPKLLNGKKISKTLEGYGLYYKIL